MKWKVNDEILMVQHDQSWDTKEMRKGIHRRRVRRKTRAALQKLELSQSSSARKSTPFVR